ncbi:predicted protein [Nematostella vectensis]|uniref:NELL2-like EGF domain-containing protein n=1 Tax=Nematostella vectensis TaxID=45351 RepID=A7SP95_NEMVE|nr:predicted protein [Nematostella vectensis]|eukprot:XP_001626564.1 predicted protein [Nematostella vectensis]
MYHGCHSNAYCTNVAGSYICTCANNFIGDGKTCVRTWSLVARFSNADSKNWMRDDGLWWFDQLSAIGDEQNPAANSDMISPLFWTMPGTKVKVTRSDDPTHTPLLVTTGDCLGGKTMRGLLMSFGNTRRDGTDSWVSDQCRHSCTVTYGGLYASTNGFEQASCDGTVQSRNKIGFWCQYDNGDAAVMMIGGGGSACARADHGIGITESDYGSFIFDPEADFGSDSVGTATDYSLNLWVL